jgi:hypothetical protein
MLKFDTISKSFKLRCNIIPDFTVSRAAWRVGDSILHDRSKDSIGSLRRETFLGNRTG